jgi:hypothetical protein
MRPNRVNVNTFENRLEFSILEKKIDDIGDEYLLLANSVDSSWDFDLEIEEDWCFPALDI